MAHEKEKQERLAAIRETFGKRLQSYRKIKGLSLAELAEKCGNIITPTTLQKYEAGKMLPSSTAITVALSGALDTPVDDFFREYTVNINFGNFEFRKKSKMGKKTLEVTMLDIQNKIEKYLEIERIGNFQTEFVNPVANRVIANEIDARNAAATIRSVWGLGLYPITQPIELLEGYGVKVIEVERDADIFDGTGTTINGMPVLVINKNDVYTDRQRMTLFHEFGHQVLKFDDSVTQKDREKLCNVFASEMLIPQQAFFNIFGTKRNLISSTEFKNVQRAYCISVKALIVKAMQLRVITVGRYKWYQIAINSRPKFREEMEDCKDIPALHSTRFEQLVLRCLTSDIITTSKAAALLGVGVDEIRKRI